MHRPLIIHTNDVVKKVGPNCSGTDNFWKSGKAKWSLAAARTNWRNLELWKRHHLFQSVFSGPLQIQRYCSVCWNTETADRPQSFVWDDFPTVEYWQCQCQGKCLQIWKRSEGRISNEMQTLSAPDTWADPTWPQPLQAVQRWPSLASFLEEQSSHASLRLCRTACQAYSLRLARESPVLLELKDCDHQSFFCLLVVLISHLVLVVVRGEVVDVLHILGRDAWPNPQKVRYAWNLHFVFIDLKKKEMVVSRLQGLMIALSWAKSK